MVVNWKWLGNNIERSRNSDMEDNGRDPRMETCKRFSLRVRVIYSDKIFVKDDAVEFQCERGNLRSYFFVSFFFQIFWNFLDILFDFSVEIIFDCCMILLFFCYSSCCIIISIILEKYIFNIMIFIYEIMIFEEEDEVNFISLIVSIIIFIWILDIYIIFFSSKYFENLICSSLLVHRIKRKDFLNI